MLKLDGSYLEGGGQIVRTALALSVLTQKAFTINNIRANRPDKGLKNQHLHCIRAVRDLCNGVAENAQLGSSEIIFYPRPILKGKEMVIDIQTAGSITLLLQSILLPCIFSGKKFLITVKGGTDVAWSPQIDYCTHVLFPHFLRYGKGSLTLQKRGYYPKGQGEVIVDIKKKIEYNEIRTGVAAVKPLFLVEKGTLVKIAGISHASANLATSRVAERQAHAATVHLQKWKVPIEIVSSYTQTASPGSGITVWAIFTGADQDVDFIDPVRVGADLLGEERKSAEVVGEECATKLNTTLTSGAPIDAHLADNIIPLLGIVGGEIAVEKMTDHTRTNIYVTEQFLDVTFMVDEQLKLIKVKK
jgi:RNA 3'-phosphate cyclase